MQRPDPVRALVPYLLGDVVIVLAILGLCWLKLGQVPGRAAAVAVGAGSLVGLFGVIKLVRSQRAAKRAHPLAALLQKAKAASGPGMEIQLCRKSLERLGQGSEPLLEGLRQRQHTPVVRECLNRCNDCRLGQLTATADGIPIAAKDGDHLLSSLDELS